MRQNNEFVIEGFENFNNSGISNERIRLTVNT